MSYDPVINFILIYFGLSLLLMVATLIFEGKRKK